MGDLSLYGTVYGANRTDRLQLWLERQGTGWDFKSVEWEQRTLNTWRTRLILTREQFQGPSPLSRWVCELHSLDAERGWAILKVAEADRPEGAPVIQFNYSWRSWDLINNSEIAKVSDCERPFDPL